MNDYSKSFQSMTLDQVAALLPTVDLAPVLEKEGVSGAEQFQVTDPGQLEAIGQILTETSWTGWARRPRRPPTGSWTR